ncbi:MAG: PKD domain-containing protein [Fibrobacteria bacterium]|nr:PKD domain-containing protein [Fibrobacteria bacterium]
MGAVNRIIVSVACILSVFLFFSCLFQDTSYKEDKSQVKISIEALGTDTLGAISIANLDSLSSDFSHQITVYAGIPITFAGRIIGDTSLLSAIGWNFGDGSTAMGQVAKHTYDSAGTFFAIFTIKDGIGFSLSDTVFVTVEMTVGGGVYGYVFYRGKKEHAGISVVLSSSLLGTSTNPVYTEASGMYFIEGGLVAGGYAVKFVDETYEEYPSKTLSNSVIRDGRIEIIDTVYLEDPYKPSILTTDPTDTITLRQPLISASFTDSASGIAPTTFNLALNGLPISLKATTTGFSWQPTTRLSDGIHTVAISILDSASNKSDSTWSFLIDAMKFTAQADSIIQIHDSLEIHAKVYDVFSKVKEYRFDFDGDNKWDSTIQTTDTAITVSYAYTHETTYKIFVSVEDDSGMMKLDTVMISVFNNAPLINTIRPDTTISIKDSISFTATATEPDGQIKEYTWDFDGNGKWDYTSDSVVNTSHRYDIAKEYKAVLRVTDDDNKFTEDTVTITVIQDSPVPNAGVDTVVTINEKVTLTGKAPQQFGSIVMYKWDFNGNGTYDDSSTSSSIMDYTYTHEAVYTVKFFVRDNDGNEATDTRQVTVENSAPVISAIRPDTTISIKDSILFTATVSEPDGQIKEYAWDFNGDGTFEYSSDSVVNTGYRYNTVGNYKAILKVTDDDNKMSQDTVNITVLQDRPEVVFFSKDTIVENGGVVRCSILVSQQFGTVVFEVDTANTGEFKVVPGMGISMMYNISTGTASFWDSVKVRVTDDDGNIVDTAFKVDIRPRALTITSIDSTVNTITVNYSKTLESDFTQYRIYRDTMIDVDSTGTPWATVSDSGTATFQSSDEGYVYQRYYYRIYQIDNEGLTSASSNEKNTRIINSPPSVPEILFPLVDNDTMWSDDTLKWTKSCDSNGHSIKYRVLITDSAGIPMERELGIGLTDTFLPLTVFDSLYINWKVVSYDSIGDSSAWSTERFSNIKKILVDSRDNQQYKYVTIGSQTWMDRNLAYLPQVDNDEAGSEDVASGKYYYVYGYTPTGANETAEVTNAKATSNYQTYGVLYNWYSAMDGGSSSSTNPSGIQGACPAGWHLPSDAEWKQLEIAIGMSQAEADGTEGRGTTEGQELKTSTWGGTNTHGFAALPASRRNWNSPFSGLGFRAYFWTVTEVDATDAFSRYLSSNNDDVFRNFTPPLSKHSGFSVRCLQN